MSRGRRLTGRRGGEGRRGASGGERGEGGQRRTIALTAFTSMFQWSLVARSTAEITRIVTSADRFKKANMPAIQAPDCSTGVGVGSPLIGRAARAKYTPCAVHAIAAAAPPRSAPMAVSVSTIEPSSFRCGAAPWLSSAATISSTG